jgi:hypothetical protein
VQFALRAIDAFQQLFGWVVTVDICDHVKDVDAVHSPQDVPVLDTHLIGHAPTRKRPHNELVVADEPPDAKTEVSAACTGMMPAARWCAVRARRSKHAGRVILTNAFLTPIVAPL